MTRTNILILILMIIYQVKNDDVILNDYVSKIYDDINNGQAPLTTKNSAITDKIRYNSKIRPIGNNVTKNVNSNGALLIGLSLSLKQIFGIDEKSQIMTSSFYLTLLWKDPRLMWNLTQYGYHTYITVGANNFWLPDIAILNGASTNNFIQINSNQNILITYDGYVLLILTISLQPTRCKMNVLKYPFDTQQCSIIIGSMSNNAYELVFDAIRFDQNSFGRNSIWDIKSVEQKIVYDNSKFDFVNKLNQAETIEILSNLNLSNEILDKMYTPLYSTNIHFNLELKRNPLYIMVNGIFPCLVLNSIILIAFSLPFSVQVGLCMTSFLTFSVTSLRIASDIPVQSDYLPLITLYFMLSIIYTLIGLIWFNCEYFY